MTIAGMSPAKMTLGDIAGDLNGGASLAVDEAARIVVGLSADSRKISPGFMFFAVPGHRANGLQFVPQAIAAGACAIVCETLPAEADPRVAWLIVDDTRVALSRAAARFYARQPQTITAVTGTSGKTSVAAFQRQIWLGCGYGAAALGTTGVIGPNGASHGSLTTPDPVTLHQTLDQLAHEGVTHLAMEASSHGLDQRRLDGVRLAAAGFTNLSRDHLDYHADLASYLAAKMRLFQELLQPGQPAVINADSDVADEVICSCKDRGLRVLTTGRRGNDLRIVNMNAHGSSIDLTIVHEGRERATVLPLAGEFMASNALVAAGLCLVAGANADAVFAALENLQGAPGRLEHAGERHGAPVLIDYAHKPDALEKVLQALRASTRGRLIVVFGCGGDRDAGKRPLMGDIAVRHADVVIVTDDNPRSEEPTAIRAQILAAAPGAIEIGDRAQAIYEAALMLREGDTLVVAGKGHETGQIVGTSVLPFSDHEAVAAALAKIADRERAA